MISIRKVLIGGALVALLVVAIVSGVTTVMANSEPQTASPSVSRAGAEPMPPSINVTGSGRASARPDVAEIQLGVETVNTDAGQAINENTERMTAVMAGLKGMKVEDKDIQTTNFNMWVEQVTDKEGKPTGEMRYHVVNQIQVRLRDLSKAGELLQQSLKAGANTVNGISFSVADQTALQREARDQAIAEAQAKAEQLATGLGVKLGPVRQVSEVSNVIVPGPLSLERGLAAAAPVPVSGGEFSVTVQIQVVFDIVQSP